MVTPEEALEEITEELMEAVRILEEVEIKAEKLNCYDIQSAAFNAILALIDVP